MTENSGLGGSPRGVRCIGGGGALISAIYVRHDRVKPAPPGIDECILVSDNISTSLVGRAPGRIIRRQRFPALDDRTSARLPKCRPDWFTDCASTVWIDGSIGDRGLRLALMARQHLSVSNFAVAEHL